MIITDSAVSVDSLMIVLLNVGVQCFILDCVDPKAERCSNTMHESKSCEDLVLVHNHVAKLVDYIQLEEGEDRVEDVVDEDGLVARAEVDHGGVVALVGGDAAGEAEAHVGQVAEAENSRPDLQEEAAGVPTVGEPVVELSTNLREISQCPVSK